jgi:hypothetical protein
MGLVRRADTRPWSADVRQASAVEAGNKTRKGGLEDLPERRETELVFGKPDDIELRELRRYPNPGSFLAADGTIADTLRIIEMGKELRVGAENLLYRVTENGEQESLEDSAPTPQWRLLSTEPGEFQLVPAPGVLNRDVAVQRSGLDVQFAGRGTCEITVEFTGVSPVQNGDSVSNLDYFESGLNLYEAGGDERAYSISSGGIISISNAAPGDEFTLYWEGRYETTYSAKDTGRLDQLLQHAISLKPIAEHLADLPSADNIACTETTNHIAEVQIQGRTVGVTEDGYVGNTFLGQQIHHVLPGPRHILAVGDGTFTICEPEAAKLRQFSVPENVLGITWTREGLLGLVVDGGDQFVVYGINEIRRGHNDGFTTRPPMG